MVNLRLYKTTHFIDIDMKIININRISVIYLSESGSKSRKQKAKKMLFLYLVPPVIIEHHKTIQILVKGIYEQTFYTYNYFSLKFRK